MGEMAIVIKEFMAMVVTWMTVIVVMSIALMMKS